MNRLIFSCRYIDSVKIQLKIITTAMDEQSKWIQVNRHAEANRFEEHQEQLEEIVKSIATQSCNRPGETGLGRLEQLDRPVFTGFSWFEIR
jgi:hypothetical protein